MRDTTEQDRFEMKMTITAIIAIALVIIAIVASVYFYNVNIQTEAIRKGLVECPIKDSTQTYWTLPNSCR